MITVDEARLADARIAGQLIASSQGRELLQLAGHEPGHWIVAAHWDEPIASVLARLEASPVSPVTLVAYRERRRVLLTVEPVDSGRHALRQDVDPQATVGM